MATLIDGYNLLHAIGILGRNIGPGRWPGLDLHF